MKNLNLELKLWPNQCLREVCPETKKFDWVLGDAMIDLMVKHNGMGLAAPQVGLKDRVFVMRDTDHPDAKKGLVFFNPIITKYSVNMTTANEGCLSLLGRTVPIRRYNWIDVEFDVPIDYDKPVGDDRLTWHFEGLHARCIQHEIDHLNGKLIFDHIPGALARKIWLEKYFKAKKKYDRMS